MKRFRDLLKPKMILRVPEFGDALLNKALFAGSHYGLFPLTAFRKLEGMQ
jgi:hypothetical protein